MVKKKNKNKKLPDISCLQPHGDEPPDQARSQGGPRRGRLVRPGHARAATRLRALARGGKTWAPVCLVWSLCRRERPPSEQAQGKKRAPAFTCTEQIQKVNRQPSDKPAGEDAAKHLGDRRALRTARRALRTAVPWPRSLSRGARATPSGPSQLRPLRTASSDHPSRPQVPARDPGPHCF